MRNIEQRLSAERRLARHVATTPFEAIGHSALESARRGLVDCFGAIIAARPAEAIEDMLDFARLDGAGGICRVPLTGERFSVGRAAWVIGAMARALELDDAIDEGPVHPTAATLPALLALTDQGKGRVSGRDLLRALAIGQDVKIRLSRALRLNAVESGRNNMFKVYAATAAAAALLGLDEDQALHALGLASSYAVGDGQCALDGSLGMRVQFGNVARGGVEASLLAQAGVTGPHRFLTGRFGYFTAYEPGSDCDRLLDGIGEKFLGEVLSVKPYASCRATHMGAELIRRVHARFGPLDAERVAGIEFTVAPGVNRLVGAPAAERRRPQTPEAAQFSMQYVAATVLETGGFPLAESAPDRLNIPSRLQLADRIEVREADDHDADGVLGRVSMVVRLADGEVIRDQTAVAPGSPADPVSEAQLRAKLIMCAGASGRAISETVIDRLITRSGCLETLADARDLMEDLA